MWRRASREGGRGAPGRYCVSVDVHEQKRLFELGAAGEQFPVAVKYEALAVEDEFVLAADHVRVGEGDLVGAGALGEHSKALSPLAAMVGRAVDVEHDLGAACARDGGGVRLEPDVLADADADPHALERKHGAGAASREVAVFVEHAVVGQEYLVVGGHQLAPVDDGGGVVEGAVGAAGGSHDGERIAGRGGDLRQAAVGLVEELAFEQQVLGRVPDEGQLGKGDDVGACLGGLLHSVKDEAGVGVEVADGGVDLREGDADAAHSGSRRRASRRRRGRRASRKGGPACRAWSPGSGGCAGGGGSRWGRARRSQGRRSRGRPPS